jgi:hypothetical protein
MQKLSVADIADHRAYEREREEFRAHVIAMKKRRRVPLGDIMTLVFENTDTMRFQVQEMVRAERMLTDEQIRREVDTYNELIPEAGELSATLLVELTDEEQLREWLPRLVGIQRAISIVLPDGSRVTGEPLDEERLTREEMTASVHFLRFRLPPVDAGAFRDGPVHVIVDHPAQQVDVELTADMRDELASDL